MTVMWVMVDVVHGIVHRWHVVWQLEDHCAYFWPYCSTCPYCCCLCDWHHCCPQCDVDDDDHSDVDSRHDDCYKVMMMIDSVQSGDDDGEDGDTVVWAMREVTHIDDWSWDNVD